MVQYYYKTSQGLTNSDEESYRELGGSNLCLLRFDNFSAEAYESDLISPIMKWRFQHCRTDLRRTIYLSSSVDVRIFCGK
jgi:hypothetical protein